MNAIKKIEDKFYNASIIEIGRLAFYIGVILEIFIFFLDRADWYNPYQSMMFKITFVFFCIKCVCTKYDKKQWIFIIVSVLFSLFAYKLTIKDEFVRATIFIISMKDITIKSSLRLNFWLVSIGVFILGVMSIFGIMGDVYASPGYGYKENAFMLSFGLGSSNTWAIQIWLLVALLVYLYHKRLYGKSYLAIFVFGIIIYILSKCKMELIMMSFTSGCGYLFYRSKKIRDSIWTYITGGLIGLFCLGFSIYAAKISTWWEFLEPWQLVIDRAFTGRISSIYAYENGGGVLSNWRLFASPNFVEYFDMGIVRLFWWYGIIPGILVVISIIVLTIYQYKNHDYMGFLLLYSTILFSLFEAHFISPFIARSYLLFMLGGTWYRIFTESSLKTSNKKIAFYIGSLAKGGAERVFVNLAEYFCSIGYDVVMITQYIRDDEYELPQGATRVISDLCEEETKGRIYNLFARIIKLHKIIRNENADLLMTTIGKANFMAVTCASLTRTKVVVSVVADPKEEYPSFIMRFLLQTLFGFADGIIMQTTQQQKFLRPGLQRSSAILPNSVSPSFVRDRYNGIRDKNIYMVGRMDDNKNQAMTIRAFADIADKHPDFKLVLLGDGPNRKELEELSSDLNITSRIEFAGIVSDVPDRLYKGYAFVLTSNTEGMPNTLLEAMSLGLACISTDCPCGGPRDIIQNEINGILVPVGDINQLALELDKILNSNQYANELGENAYKCMLSYRPAVVNARWREYFDNIICE